MYEANVSYVGQSKFKVAADNYTVNIDFPKPNQPADGIGPIPMLLGALGGCVAVYLERYLVGRKIPFNGFDINVKSDISKEAPHYLRVIDVKVAIPGLKIDAAEKDRLMAFVRNCPVHNTLGNHPDIPITLTT